MVVKQVRTEQMALQPQLMIDTVQDKAQSKRQHLATPHTINMGAEQVVIRQILTAQPHLMTSTAEKLAHSKPIPLAEQPNTTATAEKLELETGKKVVTDSNFLPHKQPKQIQKKY